MLALSYALWKRKVIGAVDIDVVPDRSEGHRSLPDRCTRSAFLSRRAEG